MVDTIDLCEDEDSPSNPSVPPGNQPCRSSQPTTIQPTLPTQIENVSDQFTSGTSTSSSSLTERRALQQQYQAYPEAFYINFITTIEHEFPWQTFAMRHRMTQDDLRRIFFVLVTLPLSDPDDNSRRLKVAQGARKRFSEWRQAWEETVANIRAECSEIKDAKEQK